MVENDGCGKSEYFIEYHDKKKIYHGHIAESGFISYQTDDGDGKSVFINELVYDSSRDGYLLPGTDYCLRKLPAEGESYSNGLVVATNSEGTTKIFSYFPKRMICVTETRCDLCGWSVTSKGAGYSETTVTSNDSNTHHVLVECKYCGEKYVDEGREHSFSYKGYTPIITDDEKSTQHSATRYCTTKISNSACGAH